MHTPSSPHTHPLSPHTHSKVCNCRVTWSCLPDKCIKQALRVDAGQILLGMGLVPHRRAACLKDDSVELVQPETGV